MPISRIPTRLKALVESIQPLADFYKVHKQDVKVIYITKRDWLFLMQTPLDTMRPAGFNITGKDGLTFGRFGLKPVEAVVKKEST